VLLLLFLCTAGAGWLYWNAPSIKTLRPNIESYLQQALELDHLNLGKLSWYWAGFLWIEMDDLSFSSSKHGIAFQDGQATIRISLAELFNGNVTPDKIQLQQGILEVVFDQSSSPILPAKLTIQDTQINWIYNDIHGTFTHVQLTSDALKRSLQATSSELQLSAHWDEHWIPEQLTLHCKHTDWLPPSIRKQILGAPQADISLTRTAPLQWDIQAAISSAAVIAFKPPHSKTSYPFTQASASLQIQLRQLPTASTPLPSTSTPTTSTATTTAPNTNTATEASPSQVSILKHITIKDLQWGLNNYHASAQGQWQDGQLQLHATSQQIPMHLIWPILKPLTDSALHPWLALMQQGDANTIQANASVAWPTPLQAWPSKIAWNALQFDLQSELEDIDIALGTSNGSLTHLNAQLNINQDALKLQITDAVLPNKLGHMQGKLDMPWDSLDLHITGTSRTDIKALLRWTKTATSSDWTWRKGQAKSNFELIWNAAENKLKKAKASLQPINSWKMTAFGFPLQLSKGRVLWDQHNGITFKKMHFSSQYMHGNISLHASQKHQQWKLTSLQARGSSKLAPLAAHFQLPIADPDGTIISNLRYDHGWFGNVDMQQASWKQLLGSSKKSGQAFALHYQAALDASSKSPTIRISKITTTGAKALSISLKNGTASISNTELEAQVNGVSTPSFKGNINIQIPFADHATWKITTKASYLNRNALPETLKQPENVIDKTWVLYADIDRFDWNNAQMSGVHINFSSKKDSLGIMQAAQIHMPQIDIMDADARFMLPGQGSIELRKFSASFEQQQLTVSATLKPEDDGGMRWKGFAELHGNFGHLVNKSGLSTRFMDGDTHLLFSGQGQILKDQPWWQGMDGRLRLRVDHGRVLEGGAITTLLSVFNITQLPLLLLGQRKDLTGPGILYKRLQMEAFMQDQHIHIRNVAMRSSAFDLTGQGEVDVQQKDIDIYLIANPLQNIDALLAKVPLLRDILGGKAHSFMRKIYHVNGSFENAQVTQVSAKEAGLTAPGIIDRLFSIPNTWFGSKQPSKPEHTAP